MELLRYDLAVVQQALMSVGEEQNLTIVTMCQNDHIRPNALGIEWLVVVFRNWILLEQLSQVSEVGYHRIISRLPIITCTQRLACDQHDGKG